MKRIFFTQQKKLNINYLPLRWGLGQYTDEQIQALISMFKPDAPDSPAKYCPKLYTTRTHPLSGEYVVVEGSRFKAKPVEPRIEFISHPIYKFNLEMGWLFSISGCCLDADLKDNLLFDGKYRFPELDLGIKGATFEQLGDELLRLNPKATIGTPFYVSKLEPVEVQS